MWGGLQGKAPFPLCMATWIFVDHPTATLNSHSHPFPAGFNRFSTKMGSSWRVGMELFPSNRPTSTLHSHFPSLSCWTQLIPHKDRAQRSSFCASWGTSRSLQAEFLPLLPSCASRGSGRSRASPAAAPSHPSGSHGGQPCEEEPIKNLHCEKKNVNIYILPAKLFFCRLSPRSACWSVLKSHGPKSNTTRD